MTRAGFRFTSDGFRLFASPKAKQRRGCAKKVRFSSEATAMACGQNYGRRAFRCRVCAFWHLTSEPQRTEVRS